MLYIGMGKDGGISYSSATWMDQWRGSTGQGRQFGAGGRGVEVVVVTWYCGLWECPLSGGKRFTNDSRVLEARIRSCQSIQVHLFVSHVTRDIA